MNPITDTTPAVWDPATGRIYTFLTDAGRSRWGGETVEELQQRGAVSPDALVLPWLEAERLHNEADRARYCTGPELITAERFDEMLNCLPPERWSRSAGAESFRFGERLAGPIASFFLRIGTDYWQINEDQSTTHDELVRLFVALCTDATGRYAHVVVTADDWDHAVDQLEDAGAEVIEDQSDEYDLEELQGLRAREAADKVGAIALADLLQGSDFLPHAGGN